MGWTQADPLYLRAPDLASRASPRRAQIFMFSLNNPNRYIDPDGMDANPRMSHAGDFSSYRSEKEQGDSYRARLLADENWMAHRIASGGVGRGWNVLQQGACGGVSGFCEDGEGGGQTVFDDLPSTRTYIPERD